MDYSQRAIIRLGLMGLGFLGALAYGVATRVMQHHETDSFDQDYRQALRPLAKEYGRLSPVLLEPGDVALAKDRKIAALEAEEPFVISVRDGKDTRYVPAPFTTDPKEARLILYVSRSGEAGVADHYTNGARAYDITYTFYAVAIPEKKVLARWKRMAYAPYLAYERRDQTGYLSGRDFETDAMALFTGALPRDAELASAFAQGPGNTAAAKVDPAGEAARSDLVMTRVKAMAHWDKGDFKTATDLFAKLVEGYSAQGPEHHQDVLVALGDLADAQRQLGDHAQAALSLHRLVELTDAQGPDLLSLKLGEAAELRDAGKGAEAVALVTSLISAEEKQTPRPDYLGELHLELSHALVAAGKLPQADAALKKAIALEKKRAAADPYDDDAQRDLEDALTARLELAKQRGSAADMKSLQRELEALGSAEPE